MNRRRFLAGAAAGAAISTLDWLRFFRAFGVPGTKKELGFAEAAAAEADNPRFLIYWFQEGGWDGYSMFNPVHTPNDSIRVIPAGELRPTPSWTNHRYRPKGYGASPLDPPRTQGNIQYGYLAQDGLDLFPDLAVVSSHNGNTFHSGGRWEYHYGKYSASLSGKRNADERTVMQAFCEAYGTGFLLPHVSWHRWLSDGELSIPSYPEGTGYYEKLGPVHAHTLYGKTPAAMRERLASLGNVAQGQRDARIRQFTDSLQASFLAEKNSESVRAFNSALQIHRALTAGGSINLDPRTLFTDPTLRAEFGITAADEATDSSSINGNPARTKETPNTNVQALMTYEMMTKGLSIGFFIENRGLRQFDTHRDRRSIMNNKGQTEQRDMMRRNLWNPLKALVAKLKATPYGTTGKSYYDFTTIVLASEMGRTIQGDVEGIIAKAGVTDAQKYEEIMLQDCCQHWRVNSVAFLGGTVRGNTQYGRVGSASLDGIPMMPNGTLDPAYDADTGLLVPGRTKNATSFVSDAGHVYATALHLSGLDPAALKAAGKGRNDRPPMTFIKR
ncbi:Protein of unknown function [Myxococcus fulvus]|uniref:Tat pathway signal sequence domain-containing protein n=1 Tax=Myxococcus fulvus TaxID=33 RepID=A0A511SY31_MYXFU|nr:DUF1501 domain-containing protein [Myxococcus fulvus]GEN06815.1 hypothetical protein MFU01_18520 [Myxococcus fulvus]SEU04599.1 Protein of unknown function [Myxococcus fulvus]